MNASAPNDTALGMKRNMRLHRLLLTFVLLPLSAIASEKKEPGEQVSITTHTLTLDGEEIIYRATAGTMLLRKEEKGEFEPRAQIFYVAYEKLAIGVDGRATTPTAEMRARRPVTFSFNGGPGSSSVWLHLGVLGPKRVLLDDDGLPPAPPARLVENEFSLLDVTDLVFIDPVSTGYSRPLPEQDPKQFHGVNEDIRAVGEFIRLYATRNERWGSPKFLIGESYGTTRAAGLAGHLQESIGMYLNGIMLVSTVLDFQTLSFHPGNTLPYALFVPTYAATAWYHGRLPGELQARPLADVINEAEEFAFQRLLPALMRGTDLAEGETAEIAAEYARLTGLPEELIVQSSLRVPMWRFAKELLREEGRTVGRFDSRYTGIDREDAGDAPDFDPSYAALLGPFTSTLNEYMRSELEFESDLPYEILTGNVHPWNYSEFSNRYVNLTDTLRRAMTFNPYLKLFVGAGFFDLATPHMAAEYTVGQLGLDPSLREHVRMEYYEAGHMMYVHRPSLEKLSRDLRSFIGQALPPVDDQR